MEVWLSGRGKDEGREEGRLTRVEGRKEKGEGGGWAASF